MSQQNSNIKQFPPINTQQALDIAAMQCKSPDLRDFKCFNGKPYRLNPYDDLG